MAGEKPYKLKMEITTEASTEGKYFEYMRFRPSQGGLIIEAKSPLFGAYLESQAKKTTAGKPSTFTGRVPWEAKYFNVPSSVWPPEGIGGVSANDFSGWFYNERPNVLWLLHIDLARGMEMEVQQPITVNDLEDYVSSCAIFCQEVYNRVLRQVWIEVVLKAEEKR